MTHGFLVDNDGHPLNVSVALSNVITDSNIPMDKMLDLMQDKVDKVSDDNSTMKSEINTLSTDSSTMKNHISTLSSDSSTMKNRIDTLTNDNVSIHNDINVVSTRVDNVTSLPNGSTTGDAELADIRVKVDGTTAKNAGTAVREQISELNQALCDVAHWKYAFDNLTVATDGTITKNDARILSEMCSFENGDSIFVEEGYEFKPVYYKDGVFSKIPSSWAKTLTFTSQADNYDGLKIQVRNSIYTSSDITPDEMTYTLHTTFGVPKRYEKTATDARVDGLVDRIETLETSKSIYNKLRGKVIVNMGDSLFNNFRESLGDISISGALSTLTGATCYSVGVGGMRMAWRNKKSSDHEAMSAYSCYALVDAICSGDYSRQEATKNYSDNSYTIPDYVANDMLPMLETINFNKVDILTIAYGTNDYTAGTPIDDGADIINATTEYSAEDMQCDDDKMFNVQTFIGALKHCVRQLQQTYPKMQVVVITPSWRYFSDGTDCKTKNYAGTGTLTDYVNALVECCKDMRIPVINSYELLSWSAYNSSTYMGDYTHPNENGRKMYAGLIDGQLNTLI